MACNRSETSYSSAPRVTGHSKKAEIRTSGCLLSARSRPVCYYPHTNLLCKEMSVTTLSVRAIFTYLAPGGVCNSLKPHFIYVIR